MNDPLRTLDQRIQIVKAAFDNHNEDDECRRRTLLTEFEILNYTRCYLTANGMAAGVCGTQMKLLNGRYLDLFMPDPDVLTFDVIATSLARECRYANQTPEFYSVAEHSALCHDLYVEAKGRHGQCRREMLMHDAAEIICDFIRPLKQMMPLYGLIEGYVFEAIAERYHLDNSPEAWAEIKRFDDMVLKAERMAFWPDDPVEWPDLEGIKDASINLRFLGPLHAKAEFAARYGDASMV